MGLSQLLGVERKYQIGILQTFPLEKMLWSRSFSNPLDWQKYLDFLTEERWIGNKFDFGWRIILIQDLDTNEFREMTDDEEFLFYGVSKSRPHGGYF